MKKNGFIATSLIYSFFMAFIALIMLIIANYISNKTILNRYSEEIANKLNNSEHSLIIYSKNATINDGVKMTNLVKNGNFSNFLNNWNIYGNIADFKVKEALGLAKKSMLIKENSINSYIFQNINFNPNNIYYLEVSTIDKNSTPMEFEIDNVRNTISKKNESEWTKNYTLYENIDGNKPLSLGLNGIGYISDILLIDLTQTFGKNFEPNIEWVSNNIKWFDQTVSYYNKSKIKESDKIVVTFTVDNPNISSIKENCIDANGKVFSPVKIEKDVNNSNKYIYYFEKIKSNIVCNIDWIV